MNPPTPAQPEPIPPPPVDAGHEGKSVLDRLIRSPDALLSELDGGGGPRLLGLLAAIALVGHLAYGLVVGSFSGGVQWWAAPSKIVLGSALCGAICFPSLYIFASFSGADVSPKRALGLVLGLLALTGVFLAGFAPISWVFSQSSTLTTFVGAIHLCIWSLSVLVSGRVVYGSLRRWKAKNPAVTNLWILILMVTCLQMMTTLRPIVGSAPRLLDPERRFFLQHWMMTIGEDAERSETARPR